MPAESLNVTDDAILGGRLRLLQPARGHRFGHDAILLAAAAPAAGGAHVVELGAGVGAAGLALLAREPSLRLILVDIEPELVALAAENIGRNGFSGQARAVALDIGGPARAFAAAGLPPGSADHVLMNPPFNMPAQQASPDRLRRRAHGANAATLPLWIRTAARLLRSAGMLTMIWRSEGLGEILSALTPTFGAIGVLPVHPSAGKPAIRVIVRASKGARAPLSLLPGFILNDESGRTTAASENVLRNGAALPL
jgi:tRNA1(Val) A37 N6-methylase TrmN6